MMYLLFKFRPFLLSIGQKIAKTILPLPPPRRHLPRSLMFTNVPRKPSLLPPFILLFQEHLVLDIQILQLFLIH